LLRALKSFPVKFLLQFRSALVRTMTFRHYGLVFLQLLLLVGYTEGSKATPELEGRLNACVLDSTPLAYSTASKLRAKGWVEQPNYRGTFDILWVSLVTIGISTYTMLCLNVPAPKDTYVQLIYRRMLWMLLGIIGPEFVLTYAAGQWSRAK